MEEIKLPIQNLIAGLVVAFTMGVMTVFTIQSFT